MTANSSSERTVGLITGGARRLGKAMVKALHESGMDIVVHYHNSEIEAHNLKKELEKKRANSICLVRGNLCEPVMADQIMSRTIEHFGRLDLLVNNASSFYPTNLNNTSPSQFNELISTNSMAPYLLSQAAANYLRKNKGAIINITDIYADRPLKSHSVYSASKAALKSLTWSLAQELAPYIRVNAIAPGSILWPEGQALGEEQQNLIDSTPLKRVGTPADIEKALLFLWRDAPYITGQTLYIDGGRSIVN